MKGAAAVAFALVLVWAFAMYELDVADVRARKACLSGAALLRGEHFEVCAHG